MPETNPILQSLYARKSVRVFEEKAIPAGMKQAILEAAAQAPSAGCQQLYTILDITDPALKAALADSFGAKFVDAVAGDICRTAVFTPAALAAVAARVSIPIIASGGAGKKEDFLELFHHKGIDAGLAAGIFHQKLLGIRELKEYLNANGVEMRL